jgi:hypothetical protein
MGYEILNSPALLDLCDPRKTRGSDKQTSSSAPDSAAARRGTGSDLQRDVVDPGRLTVQE